MIGQAARVAAFERDEHNASESLALLDELTHAGSWHTARCIPNNRCTCETPPTRKAS